jgi:transmembrane sensor
MKRNKQTKKQMTDQEWATAAAWLSGEGGSGEEAAHILISEEGDIMKKWNDLKQADKEDIDVDNAWEKLNRRIEAESPAITLHRPSFMQTFVRIAAMVVFVAGLGWLFFEVAAPKQITVASAADQKNVEVMLPDGSMVYLNRNSTLTYPKHFNNSNRKVSLEGEAFFDIARDESHPFILDAGQATVRVLGTSFNVITDNGNDEVEVFVSSGSVMVTSADGSRSETLEPDYVGRISDREASQARNTNVNYMSWHTNMLVFDGERLENVFTDLKRTFDIDIIAADPAINDYRLTSPFEDQPHDTIIKVICTTFNLHSAKEEGIYRLYPGQME